MITHLSKPGGRDLDSQREKEYNYKLLKNKQILFITLNLSGAVLKDL